MRMDYMSFSACSATKLLLLLGMFSLKQLLRINMA
jgi:hypothetical protein